MNGKFSTRTQFTVETTGPSGIYRKTDENGCWTTYGVAPMTLAAAERVCYDHGSRGTVSKFRIIDVEYERAEADFARACKLAFLEAAGWNELSREERMTARDLREQAISVYVNSRDIFLNRYLRSMYCV